ncbi:alpha-N-acetylgalactosaminidase-like isoform X1 [Scyliorhinus canicula]|uniref:alpha-N-acetylgalactosaminidase-like isoform X1 n=2 Tax=Scyliorhinus canicula TaxID=7830 RepID=UPI0018F7C0D7|nr:alpha-N-acetylgalactosaminidase-like isoform X1 [Scyliorhinus canicula]XP_038676262.1 alpha-N-acetylgalactosaminidase-like isoform X1 [Scyliorhinus canicula]
MHCRILSRFITFLPILCGPCQSLDNGLARTPPMGWIAWERFRCTIDCDTYPDNCISESLFRSMADKLVEDGWKDLGYQYINIDDCWSATMRDANGKIQPDPVRFPNGIKGLADYVHSKGLKLGIYGDLGIATCGGFPGTTLENVDTDAKTFAEWEIDMLKFDGCNSNSTEKAIGYPKMSHALNATGRPIIYSCSWPAYEEGLPPKVNYTLIGELCNLWRNYEDVDDSWNTVLTIINWFGDNQKVLQPVAGPGRWNDPDMLIVGDFGLNHDQSKSQLALWAMLAAPFFMSNDLRTISDEAKTLLQNRLLIHIDQDHLGLQGERIEKDHDFQVWKRNLTDGQFAVAFLCTATDGNVRSFRLSLPALFIEDCLLGYNIYDVFGKKLIGSLTSNETHSFQVNPTGVALFFIRPKCKLF